MNKELRKLYAIFLRIKEIGFIKSKRKGPTGVGYTFEVLIGKKEDDLPIPDFYGIEIKTVIYNRRRKIHLFNLTPDGDFLFPIKRIIEKLGYQDRTFKECKIFNATVNTIDYTFVRNNMLKLKVNKEQEKLELLASTRYGEDININISWSYSMLKDTLLLKLNKLAIVKAKHEIKNDEDYFLYNYITFYQLKGFEKFIELLDKGIISITFNISVYKSGKKIGKIHDRGTNFFIMEKDIEMLFDHIKG